MCGGGATRASRAQEGQASPAGVELALESRDEEMNEASETNNAENVKPRIDESRDDFKGITSRMESGNYVDTNTFARSIVMLS